MNQQDKNNIINLQRKGMGYKRIADALGLSVNSVKSYCYRHPCDTKTVILPCKQCGVEITQAPHRKEKRFCSDGCRSKWWNANADKMKRKGAVTFVCPQCDREFVNYPKHNRTYCSRECYANARRKPNEQ